MGGASLSTAVLLYPPNLVFNTTILVVCVYAFVAGRGFTRFFAAYYVAATALLKAVSALSPEIAGEAHLAANVAGLGVLASRALHGGPAWTLFATAFQLMICGLWLVRAGVDWNTLITATRIWEYLVLAALGSRAWQEARARAPAGRKTRA